MRWTLFWQIVLLMGLGGVIIAVWIDLWRQSRL